MQSRRSSSLVKGKPIYAGKRMPDQASRVAYNPDRIMARMYRKSHPLDPNKEGEPMLRLLMKGIRSTGGVVPPFSRKIGMAARMKLRMK